MALSKLSGDEQGTLFTQLCNALEPGVAVCVCVLELSVGGSTC